MEEGENKMLSYLTDEDMKRIDKNGVKSVIKSLEYQLNHCNRFEKEKIESEIRELKKFL